MSLIEIAQEIKEKERTLIIYNPPPNSTLVADIKDHLSNMNVRVTTQQTLSPELADAAHLQLHNNTIVTVSHSLLRTFVSGDRTTHRTEKSEGEFSTFLKNIKLTTFTTTDVDQMRAVYDEIVDRAQRTNGATLHISLHDEVEPLESRNEYTRLENQNCPVVLYATPHQRVPNSDVFNSQIVDVDEIGRVWLAVCASDQQPSAKTALVAIECGSLPFYGFWTDDPGIVDRILSYLATLRQKY